MEILKAIEILKSRNQNFVNKNGTSDYSRQSDEIINAMINLYMLSKAYQQELDNTNNQMSQLADQVLKYKLFLSTFELPVKRVDNIHIDILKIIDREKIADKYAKSHGFFCIEFLFIEIENIQTEIRNFLFPVTAYYETNNQEFKKLFPNHSEFFNAIDNTPETNLQAFDNIYYDAYKFIISRLTYINNE